jgi:hypothetical protein
MREREQVAVALSWLKDFTICAHNSTSTTLGDPTLPPPRKGCY